jgi:hypothetical protein
MAKMNFNASAVELPEQADSGNYVSKYDQPIPEGEYLAEVVETDIRATKKGNGHYTLVKWEVAEGDHIGRWLFEYHNHDNPNEKAVEIAARNLKKICNAFGIDGFDDTDELMGKRAILSVGIDKKDNTRNNVYDYASVQSNTAPKTDTEATTSRPWNR